MRKLVIVGSLALIGAAPPPSTDAKLRDIVAPVSQAQVTVAPKDAGPGTATGGTGTPETVTHASTSTTTT